MVWDLFYLQIYGKQTRRRCRRNYELHIEKMLAECVADRPVDPVPCRWRFCFGVESGLFCRRPGRKAREFGFARFRSCFSACFRPLRHSVSAAELEKALGAYVAHRSLRNASVIFHSVCNLLRHGRLAHIWSKRVTFLAAVAFMGNHHRRRMRFVSADEKKRLNMGFGNGQ